jgi:hypothetical protein
VLAYEINMNLMVSGQCEWSVVSGLLKFRTSYISAGFTHNSQLTT